MNIIIHHSTEGTRESGYTHTNYIPESRHRNGSPVAITEQEYSHVNNIIPDWIIRFLDRDINSGIGIINPGKRVDHRVILI